LIAVFFGPPGAGKGTQASLLARHYNIAHISTGEMFRAEIAAGTMLGQEVEPIIAGGSLVPDELTVRILESRLDHKDAAGGALFDGFPRTVAQAQALDRMLTQQSREITVVIQLNVPDAVLRQRILERGAVEGRPDDTEEAFAKRISVYRQQTEPVIDYYKQTGARLEDVDGVGSVEEVNARILAAVLSAGGQRV
jgi:adenylate kinase